MTLLPSSGYLALQNKLHRHLINIHETVVGEMDKNC